jgi:hypothetical protein
MELCRLTPQNAHGYIGYEVLFKSRGASIVKKLISVSKTSVQVDHPDLCNNITFSRRIYVLVEEEAVEEEEDAMTFFESLEKEEEATQRQESTLEDAMAFLESLEEKKEEAVVTPSDAAPSSPNRVRGCREMSKCFTNGQRIRHTGSCNKTWIGIYNSSANSNKGGVDYDDKLYNSPSGFAETHYSIDRPDRVSSANGWKECEYEVDGKWISTYHID